MYRFQSFFLQKQYLFQFEKSIEINRVGGTFLTK